MLLKSFKRWHKPPQPQRTTTPTFEESTAKAFKELADIIDNLCEQMKVLAMEQDITVDDVNRACDRILKLERTVFAPKKVAQLHVCKCKGGEPDGSGCD